MDKKRKKDPTYQLASTGRWTVSPEAQKILDRIEKRRARRLAWIEKQRKEQAKKN